MMEIVLLDTATLGDVLVEKCLKDCGTITTYDHTSPEQTVERIGNARIIITNKVAIGTKELEQAPSLELICIAATGMDHVDVAAAEKKGIAVKNVKGYSTSSVAQHTYAMMFYLLGSLPYYDDYVKSGKYANESIFTHHGKPFSELSSCTIGIIGMGAIGRQVAAIATVFGARVIYHSTSGKNTDQPYELVDLDTLCEQSDVISIHAPLNAQTRNLITAETFHKMKRTVVLLNTGRGGIINEKDLAEALDKELIGAAGIDVLEKEPIEADHPLLKVKNKERLLLTPHIAWAGRQSRERLMEGVRNNILEFIRHQ